jgi:dipeptidyl aminopeptidase/acylaminoacyl peptidase
MPTRPWGTWRSPLGARDLAAGVVRLSDLRVDGDALWWTELRPADGGRTTIVRHDGTAGVDVAPEDVDARTRVHEYGGAPFAVRGGRLVASHDADQRLHVIDGDGARPVTPPPSSPRGVRYADGQLTLDGQGLVCVRETHGPDGAGGPRNEIVLLDLDGDGTEVLVAGPDFVAAPRLSPDATELAWLQWDHPAMPWDAAELHVAAFDGRRLGPATHLGGGRGDAAYRPLWLPDGRLVASVDTTGFWEVHLREGGRLRRVTDLGADVGWPHWIFGNEVVAPLPDGRLALAVTRGAETRLALLDLADGAVTEVDAPYTAVSHLQPTSTGVAFLAASPDVVQAVVTYVPGRGLEEVRRVDLEALRPGDRPRPRPVEVPTPDGAATHAFVYPPASEDHEGPADARPPLVVFTHGGPTGHVAPALSAQIAYWTSRGFAVADVNYRGSSGFGRAYREALKGQWGVHDVTDVVAVARHLAEHGEVDGDRMVIRGGSAGGFTTLAVLTAPDHPFAAGTSFFGVADVAALMEHTHEFESRYLDGLVGPLPEAAQLCRDRSPLTHVDRLRRPLLVLQGLEDAVVPPEQSEAIVEACARRGIPHAYLAFEGEQHGFRKAENVVTWLESELAFYGLVLGFEPADAVPDLRLEPPLETWSG